ncbi:hypothetical protein HDV05_003644 [Chytridiales sp. JEL 0842]|nr:hypothetical protein HDV05_003644 [Chytridiales sp. JEL 0842]
MPLAHIKVRIVSELRDQIEIVNTPEYPRFLEKIVPAFSYVLSNTPAAFASNSPAHKLRNMILEIIHRFPHNDALKAYAVALMDICISVLKTDNEDNAVICLKIIMELHKNFKASLEEKVEPFFEIVQQMYKNMVDAVKETFDEVLTLQPEAQKKSHEEASAKGEIFVGVSSNIRNRVAYSEFKALQVKLTSLRMVFPIILKYHYRKKNHVPAASDSYASAPELDGFVDLGYAQPIRTSSKAWEASQEVIKDIRFLLKTIIQGLKPILFALKACSSSSTTTTTTTSSSSTQMMTDTENPYASGFSEDETRIFIRLLKDGLHCFDYYITDFFDADGTIVDRDKIASSVAKEDKEVFEAFAAVFTYIEPSVFQEVLASQIEYFFDRILVNPGLQALPQYLLGLVTVAPSFTAGSPNFVAVSPNFAGLLLRFLVDNLKNLGGSDQIYSSAMLRLFKVVFMAVTKYPEKNEAVLRPHVGTIILKSMKLSATAKEPLNYFLLLRSLFRSIGGGRFEALYQEVLPLLEVLLEGLNSLLATAHKQQMKELFVELCLTVPVRLSVLLPYLSFLMKPLVLALQAGPELVSQGLRTLELCIDNLTQDFLEPIMGPVICDLMRALWKHLKPLPYKTEHSHTTLRILGKLGGRNRRMLSDAISIGYKPNAEAGIELFFKFYNIGQINSLPLDEALEVSKTVLENPASPDYYKEQAFLFAKSCVPLLIEAKDIPSFAWQKSTEEGSSTESLMDIDGVSTNDFDKQEESPFADPPLIPRSKRESQDCAVNKMMYLLLLSTTVESVKTEAQALVGDLSLYFAVVCHSETIVMRNRRKPKINTPLIDAIINSPSSRVEGYVDAIVQSMTCEDAAIRAVTEASLKTFTETCLTLSVTTCGIDLRDIQVFHTFASKFCSSCYRQEWFKKNGGCLGISFLTSRVDLGQKWILDHELDFVKALLYVLKDTSPEMASSNAEGATQTLFNVLKLCNTSLDITPGSEKGAKFNSLISLLISELSNSNSAVRETIQGSFQILADLIGSSVTELLTPVRDRLLSPIFSKPLRALPFAMQIGHIDAITYCLSLRPSLLSFSDELLRLLHEALALADAEDQALVSKPLHYKNSASLTNLRVVCIKLLSAAMACPEFSAQKQVNTRARIISVFFKSLYAKSIEVVEVAYKGLQQVLSQQHKLPKELLQAGLKPILVNLSDYKRLTVPALEGLARLLELLTNYFKVEIGRKLLDHLRQWADPAVLENAAGRPLSEIEEIKIIVAILNVFYLLPASANIFLDDLITVILELEGKLRRNISSPFRLPLIKFINRYPAEALDYFLDKLKAASYGNLFVDLVGHELGDSLRQELMNNSEKICTACFVPIENDEVDHLATMGCRIIEKISQHHPDWLIQSPTLVSRLKEYWSVLKNRPTNYDETISSGEQYRLCLQLFIHICTRNRTEVDLVFDLLEGFNSTMVLDSSFLKVFIYEEVVQRYDATQKKGILECFLKKYNEEAFSDTAKAVAFRMLITPMLYISFRKGEAHEVIDASSMELIHNRVWQPFLADSWEIALKNDVLKVELLQFTALLVDYAPLALSDLRKDIIKFAWNHLKIEDITCKQAAYVLLSKFIQEFETPSKIVIQIFVALLKAHQPEGRTLVKQALDVLLPALPKRIATSATDSKVPTWVRWTRKIILEDGYGGPHLNNIYQLLIRHSDLFYENRDSFLSHIVNSLPKLGLSPNCTPETKALAVDLCELILKWESQQAKVMQDDRMQDVESNQHGTDVGGKEQILAFLVRFVSCTREPALSSLVQHCMDLVISFMGIWPDLDIKFNYFEKALTFEPKEEFVFAVTNSIKLLRSILENKTAIFIVSSISSIHACIESWARIDHPGIAQWLATVLATVYKALAQLDNPDVDKPVEVVGFTKTVESVICKGLQNMTNLTAVVSFLSAAYEYRPAILEDRILSDVMKLLQKLTKDHLAADISGTTPNVSDSNSAVLIALLQVLKSRINHIKDHRRTFHECLLQIVSESSDIRVLRAILSMVKDWIFKTEDPFPTIKEKANLMVKMMVLEHRNDKPLYEEYLRLIASIYSDERFARTDLTVRLERGFLMGTKADSPPIRKMFSDIFSSSMEEGLFFRLNYIIGVQNWEHLADSFWLRQAADLLVDSINVHAKLSDSAGFNRISVFGDALIPDDEMMMIDGISEQTKILARYRSFAQSFAAYDTGSLLKPLKELLYASVELTSWLWCTFFPICWNVISQSERQCISKLLIPLLAKDYHLKQADSRPNVIQAILEGVCHCNPSIALPPQLIKYAGKQFNAWYIALELLQRAALDNKDPVSNSMKEDDRLRESNLDALAQIFDDMSEDDYLYGLWRRRCVFAETNLAVSYEQSGLWSYAQSLFETVQLKARSGVLPFSESEYILWDDHWAQCTERLQQWDLLTDVAKHEGNSELLLECAWRLSDWISDREFLETTIFESFIALQKAHDNNGDKTDFRIQCEEGMQLALKAWNSLPFIVSNAHIQVLHAFQQFVELQEAGQIQDNLLATTAGNIEIKSQELKGILLTWRERLPNVWDDINLWSDLVSWRQHVFTTINKSYLPLIPPLSQSSGAGNPNNSHAYRGYHETAWIINRFSHVARKHQLTDVCITSLSKIYTLPNIEIPEAFFKLREQAKCHFQSPAEYATGLDVINNTNLHYFSQSQKAEFWTLKATFMGKLNLHEDAAVAFATATQIDMALPKAWAAWGQYCDRMFKEQPKDISYGVKAVNSYAQAAWLYNNARSRKYLARILWLLSIDDSQQNLCKSYEAYKGDIPLWYWITFIPQLLTALSNKEAPYARTILMKLAKSYPQALHFQLRTTKEDYTIIKKQALIAAASAKPTDNGSPASGTPTDAATAGLSAVKDGSGKVGSEGGPPQTPRRQPWEYVEEVMALLKTAFPLLALSMETMVDQMAQRLKPTTDEDIYRLIVALLTDGLQQLARDPSEHAQLCQATEANLARFAETMKPNHLKYKAAFEADFIKNKPCLTDLVKKFREWRNKLEPLLDSRPRKQHLEHFSHYLVEFEYQKFDDIEVPGQYFLLKDNSKDFTRIDRFQPEVEVLRGHASCSRRLTIRGHDGTLHPFNVQHPAFRQCRREERIVQLFRIMSSILDLQDDISYVSLQDIYEDHCHQIGIHQDDPVLYYINRMKELYASGDVAKKGKVEILNFKTEIMEDIAAKMIPDTILANFMSKSMKSHTDLWLIRKQFTSQMAAVTFMTYLLSIGHRYPQRFHISLNSGNVWASELLPTISNTSGLFSNTESVPFRLTPNIQNFITPIGMEGVFTSSLMAVARSLSEPEYELEDFLSIFVRDELITWQNVSRKPSIQDHQLRDYVVQNVDMVVKRAQALSCKAEREKALDGSHPSNQSVLDLISQAGNPLKLAQMDPTFLAML